ncbi:oxygen-independent coproporphyrinogen III oxidase [Novosphingobium taihuense]|uniref:Coproporphyrinogen-III oxidase n=1 Tax=Novosphingobium taihuense TaxID=260085 RepID=A0A7W7A9T3_9SPHN|nr:oxygen-independent coproporphyrinogen III oxidase [Novosphingobium taihuense]MBB4612434.1 oxygen-independent coproporphyrinogen-3 oxidase [Novosphingobium taihuense]TWH88214.1 oxygen-independent coproporphyrinogen-3 oxidase [Novosphingobium taihuense]
MAADVMTGPETFAGWTYWPELLETPVPRYTSYPTAAEFVEESFEERQRAALQALRGTVSLYLHIPYCQEICWYCGCNTGAANKSQRLGAYLEALHHEIELVSRLLHPSVRVSRIAFGGGSPNAIKPTDFVRLVDRLTLNFRLEKPVLSIELDPRTLAPDWFMAIRGIGVIKASLGVQTLDPRVQEAIGRIQPRDLIARATDGLRNAGVDSVNFDLMYGLPFQTDEILSDTLEQSVAMGADRVALFGYAHVPHMIPRQKRIDVSQLPDQRARFRMAAQGHAQLASAGYQPVGFDHFALPEDDLAVAARTGTLRRNFQGFTEDQSPVLLGLGASSISEFPELFVQTEKNAGRYRMLIGADQLAGRKGVARSAEDRRRGTIITDLLCRGSATIDADLLAGNRDRLEPFIARGLASLSGNVLTLAKSSEPYARSIAAVFDAYRSGVRQFSSAV